MITCTVCGTPLDDEQDECPVCHELVRDQSVDSAGDPAPASTPEQEIGPEEKQTVLASARSRMMRQLAWSVAWGTALIASTLLLESPVIFLGFPLVFSLIRFGKAFLQYMALREA